MPEFRYLERPVFSPTACALCGTADVPVVDTGVERDVIGRVYLCCKPDPTSNNRGCAEQIAALLGWASPEEHTEIVQELADMHETNEQLATEITNLDQPLVIYEGDLQQAFRTILDEAFEELDLKKRKK